MLFSSYQAEDFLMDDSFIAYCLQEDSVAVAKWENILDANPQLVQKINEARDLCLLLALKVRPAEKAIALKRLKNAITAAGELKPDSTPVISLRNYFTRWAAIAACLLIIAGAVAVYAISNNNPSGANLYNAATDVNYKLIGQTDAGRRKQIRLPDGSLVLLNGSSTLKIANDYNINNRHLLLSGEAFFSVAKNKLRPFVVITGKTATTALGTSFKVESYDNAKVASVMLLTGKVKVECTQPDLKIKDVTIIPGQKASLYNGDRAFTQTTFYTTDLQSWTDRKLIFRSADMKEIAAKLQAIYGVDIMQQDRAADGVSFTGEFIGKDLTEVLDAIGFTNHFTYKQNGNTVQLQF